MATQSIGLTGRDFSTLAAWATYVNALTLTAPEIGEVYNDGGPVVETGSVTLGGWTGASSTNTVTLRAAAGHGFRDHASAATNPIRYNASLGAAIQSAASYMTAGFIQITGGFFRLEGLQILTTALSSSGIRVAGASTEITRNVIEMRGDASKSVIVAEGASALISRNVLIAKNAGTIVNVAFASGTQELIGNTMVAIGTAPARAVRVRYSSSVRARNNVAFNCTADFVAEGSGAFTADSGNNATSNASFSNTNAGQSGQVSVVAGDFTNVTAGSEDLRPASGSAKLLNTGATAGLAVDIMGTTAPQGAAYDIGAVEVPVGSDTTPPTITGPTGAAGAASIAYNLPEGTTSAGTWSANETVTWTKSGADAALFNLDSSTGVLTFVAPPDFELPADAGGNNVYDLTITATDAASNASSQTVAISITDVAENAAPIFIGANIANQASKRGEAITPLDVSGRFSDTDALTFSARGTWPAGVTVSSAGVISGAPTAAPGTFAGLQVRATDTSGGTVDSNTFTFTVTAATLDLSGFDLGGIVGGQLSDIDAAATVSVRCEVYAEGLLAGAPLVTTAAANTSAAGVVSNITDGALSFGQRYVVLVTEQAAQPPRRRALIEVVAS